MPGMPRRRKKRRATLEVTVVKDLQKFLRADVLEACGTLDAKLSIVRDRQCELLATIENFTKFTEVIQTTAKELEDKVGKVNKATDKIASTATVPRRPPVQTRKQSEHRPRLLTDIDRKARQAMLDFDAVAQKGANNKSPTELREKANQTLTDIDDPTCLFSAILTNT